MADKTWPKKCLGRYLPCGLYPPELGYFSTPSADILPRIAARIAASAATRAAAAGGSAVAGAAAGGSAGTALGGPVGAGIGIAVGIAAGIIADKLIMGEFKEKLEKECHDLLNQMQSDILNGSAGETGLKALLEESITLMAQAESEAILLSSRR